MCGAAIQAQRGGDGLEGFDAESYVLFEIDAKSGGAVDDVVAIDFAGEGFIFHSFSDGLHINFG